MKPLKNVDKWHKSFLKKSGSRSERDDYKRFLLIHGLAGSGKTTIAQTASRKFDEDDILAGTFFCSRNDVECSNVLNIIPTLVYQLCMKSKAFRDAVSKALEKDPDLHLKSPSTQLKKLIVDPLRSIPHDEIPQYVFVIDALDECSNVDLVSALLDAFAEHMADLGPLIIMFTSRFEAHISKGFHKINLNKGTEGHNLDKVATNEINADIRLFLKNRLAEISYDLTQPWPSKEDLEELVERAQGLFIFASTAVMFLEDRNECDLDRQLQQLLESTAPSSDESPYAKLDLLYTEVLRNAFGKAGNSLIERIRKCFGILMSAFEPLSVTQLSWATGYDSNTIRNTFRYLRSLVVLPDGGEEAIRLIHQSLQDFLTNAERCKDGRFLVTSEHSRLAGCCVRKLAVFSAHLYRHPNVKHLFESGDLERKIPEVIRNSKDAVLSYSHSYFARHLKKSDLDKELRDALQSTFLEPKMIIYHAGRNRGWTEEFSLILFRLISTLPVSVYCRVNQEYLHYYRSLKEQHSFLSESVICIYEYAIYYVAYISIGKFPFRKRQGFYQFIAPIREAKRILSKRLPYDA